ncbi:MAG: hypothetical protein ABR586_04960, partial [Thermoplasmatota archaeon]
TVVLRAGPPPKRGTADAVVGLIGLLLLLSTVGLAVALPHKDVLPQQFKVTWLDEAHDLTQQSFTFHAGGPEQSHDFLYEVPDDDAYLLTVKYEFRDDIAASLPDQFKLRLYDPLGNEVGPEVLAVNVPAGPLDPVAVGPVAVAPEYKAVLMSAQFSVALPKPSDDILEVQDQAVNATTLSQQLGAKAHLETHGTWKLRVTLLQAGGCPDPSGGLDPANRNAACRQGLEDAGAAPQDQAAGTDGGNPFTVGVFSYSRFAPDIQKIG